MTLAFQVARQLATFSGDYPGLSGGLWKSSGVIRILLRNGVILVLDFLAISGLHWAWLEWSFFSPVGSLSVLWARRLTRRLAVW